MFLPDILGAAVWWPLMGAPCRSLVSTSHHKKKNIQADPHIAHTQSKANTLCHVRGLSHVLTCFWPLTSSPECPGWYPHHPFGWLTPLNRKGLLPWPTMLTQRAEEPGWVTSYPVQAVLHLEHDNFMKRGASRGKHLWKILCFVAYSPWIHTLSPTFPGGSHRPEESCESAIHENIAEMKSGWKYALFFKGFGRQPAII